MALRSERIEAVRSLVVALHAFDSESTFSLSSADTTASEDLDLRSRDAKSNGTSCIFYRKDSVNSHTTRSQETNLENVLRNTFDSIHSHPVLVFIPDRPFKVANEADWEDD